MGETNIRMVRQCTVLGGWRGRCVGKFGSAHVCLKRWEELASMTYVVSQNPSQLYHVLLIEPSAFQLHHEQL